MGMGWWGVWEGEEVVVVVEEALRDRFGGLRVKGLEG